MPLPYSNRAPIHQPVFLRIADKAAAAVSEFCRPLAEQGFALIIEKQSEILLKSSRPLIIASGVVTLSTRIGGPRYLARAFCERTKHGVLTAYVYFTNKDGKGNQQAGIAKISQADTSARKIEHTLHPFPSNSLRTAAFSELLLNTKSGKNELSRLPSILSKDPKLSDLLESPTLASPQKQRVIDSSLIHSPVFDSILKSWDIKYPAKK